MEVLLDDENVSGVHDGQDLLGRVEDLKYEGYEFKTSHYIEKGFRLFFKKPGYFLGYFLLVGLVSGSSYSFYGSGFNFSIGEFYSSLYSLLIAPHLMIGWFIVAHKIDRDEPVTFGNFFESFKKFWPVVLVNLVVGLCIVAGFVALIIPGIFLAVALCFALFPVYFNDLTVGDSLRVSFQFVKKKWFSFFGFFILLFLINIGGIIALFVGVFITAPASILAYYAAYQDIIGISRLKD